jgi:hypothetical protein
VIGSVARNVSYLTDPDEFFAQRADDPDWLVPFLLVVSAGVLPAIGTWYSARQLSPPGSGSFATITAVVGGGGALVGVMVVWVVGAAVFHGVSALFDGEGSFWRTLWLSGWGYVPALLSGGATMAAFVLAVDAVPAAETAQEFVQINRRLQQHQYVQWATYFGTVMSLWQGVIWTFAVRHARDIEVTQAAVAVAPVVLLNVGGTFVGFV